MSLTRAEIAKRCRDSHTDYYPQYRQMWRSAIAILKLDAGCADCGYNARPEALQFDHVNSDKEFSIGKDLFSGTHKALKEIEKCEVVCANCHALRTVERMDNGAI